MYICICLYFKIVISVKLTMLWVKDGFVLMTITYIIIKGLYAIYIHNNIYIYCIMSSELIHFKMHDLTINEII